MKAFFLSLVALALAAFVLAGCGEDDSVTYGDNPFAKANSKNAKDAPHQKQRAGG
ncbi:MAG: hypothetical protein JST35_05560 [Armatimonadetes bacterium]|nr:hypothetical protein [Armatimonadota bacterium]